MKRSPRKPSGMGMRRGIAALLALLCCLSFLLSCQDSSGRPESTFWDSLQHFADTTVGTTVTTEGLTAMPPVTTYPYIDTTTAGTTQLPPLTTTTPPATTTPAATTTAKPVTTTTKPATTKAPETPPTPANPYQQQSRNAKYVLLYDITDGKVLYTTGADQQIYPASTTKLLTLYYALTLIDSTTVLTVGSEIDIAPSDSSKAYINKGEKYTFRDLIAALLLPSGNDAAYTIAVHCGRLLASDSNLAAKSAVTRFMDGLNAYAASIGLTGTHFVTPDGYHDPEHVTTIGDILQIALMAKNHYILAEIMGMANYTATDLVSGRKLTWKNSNNLIQSGSAYYYRYATGGKTGFHTPAGACLVATAQKNGRELMVLIFKCSDKNARFTDAKNFLELGFAQQGTA